MEEKNEETVWELIIHRYVRQSCLSDIWGAEGGGNLQYENNSSSTRELGATYAWKSCFSSSCKYTHNVPALVENS